MNALRSRALETLRKSAIRRAVRPLPNDAAVPVAEADDVVLLCSGYQPRLHLQTYVQELAFAHELQEQGRTFALTRDPSIIFDKNVAWFLPGAFVSPRLWDYSRQATEFALGLERQGNRVFRSSEETRFWENKAHMHRRIADAGIPTPKTVVVSAEEREATYDFEPVIVKQEHSAGSAGIHYFATASQATEFVRSYPFRPTENLIVQELVHGATRDLRLTVVGTEVVETASYWRIKSEQALARPDWTPTATTYGSTVEHRDLPAAAVRQAAEHVAALGLRTAGIDLIWADDDLDSDALMLELSPYYQPNPPKPARYSDWTYKQYKRRSHVRDGYLEGQYRVFREIAHQLIGQGLF